ncbi:BTB/POZ domain-containing protein 16-like isoform X2 [Elysia marginata]|uniref:BTB/POZ domain-containing protein 16-like isoform X2 n=1 Tax=Elysia marginata TaxID=1093978 RepID=A0AAV4JRH1_9GAST|nr:BTB/POZ domain-containing protein 16-like isoform X2 [Elysia marginata]
MPRIQGEYVRCRNVTFKGFACCFEQDTNIEESPRCRVRRQTGLTNRWRLPESLYSDLLGSSQALKAINMPFNQSLVEAITGRCVAHNPMLSTCSQFAHLKENNWSMLFKQRKQVKKEEDGQTE